MKTEILNMAKGLLPGDFDEDRLGFWAADVESYICAYCGVEEVPAGCETLAARMIAAAADGSLGDGSASYEAGSRPGIEDFDRRLQRFRRLRWDGR